MEKDTKKNKRKNIIIGIIIGLVISALGILAYYLISGNDGMVRQQIEIKHRSEQNINNNELTKQVTLDEEDVKKWLNENAGMIMLFVQEKNNFDSETADNTKYSGILGWYLLFGGANNNAIDTKTLDGNSNYTYQYTYNLDYIKNILNKYFSVDMNVIDPNLMNTNFNGFGNFTSENNQFIVKVVATGLDNYTTSEIKNISLNENEDIVVNYELNDCMVDGSPDNCIKLGNREIVLKKVNNGYNILKAYDVKN